MLILYLFLILTIASLCVNGGKYKIQRKHHHRQYGYHYNRHHRRQHHVHQHHSYGARANNFCPCGETDFEDIKDVEGRIMNGKEVYDLRKYPWVVVIKLRNPLPSDDDKPWGFCNGAIISPTFILTAGHCLDDLEYEHWERCKHDFNSCVMKAEEVQIGLLGENKHQPSQVIAVKRIIFAPGYEPRKVKDDLALLELHQSVPCSPYSKPICIEPPQEVYATGRRMHVAGFGSFTHDNLGLKSSVLREGIVEIADSNHCAGRNSLNPSKIVCTFVNQETTETTVCLGDSGATTFIRKGGRFYSLGVVSHGDGFCTLGTTATYRKTTAYLEFIKRHVTDLPPQP